MMQSQTTSLPAIQWKKYSCGRSPVRNRPATKPPARGDASYGKYDGNDAPLSINGGRRPSKLIWPKVHDIWTQFTYTRTHYSSNSSITGNYTYCLLFKFVLTISFIHWTIWRIVVHCCIGLDHSRICVKSTVTVICCILMHTTYLDLSVAVTRSLLSFSLSAIHVISTFVVNKCTHHY